MRCCYTRLPGRLLLRENMAESPLSLKEDVERARKEARRPEFEFAIDVFNATWLCVFRVQCWWCRLPALINTLTATRTFWQCLYSLFVPCLDPFGQFPISLQLLSLSIARV